MRRDELLDRMEEHHRKAVDTVRAKNHDYADEDNPFSNFTFSGLVTSFFASRGASPATLTFVNLISTKLARLAELQTKKPENESVADTFLDLQNYVALWWCWWEENYKHDEGG